MVATVAALVVMAATFTLLPVRPARAYLFYSTPCHYDHDQKDQIQMNFGGSPEKWLPDHPDFYSWYYYRAQEAANYWTLDSDVSIIRNDYSIAWTKMHIGVQTYSEDDGRYAFTRIWLGQCDGSKHWTRKPATAVRINATSGGMGADREKDRKNLAAAAFVHEFGHALGLDHVWDGCGSGWNYGIMQPTLASYTQCGWFRPQSDDINGIQALYDPSK